MLKKGKFLKNGDLIKHINEVVDCVVLSALKLPSNKCLVHTKSGKVYTWCKNTLISLGENS